MLAEAAQSREVSLSGLVASVDAERDGTTPLASALRLLALHDALGRAGSSVTGQVGPRVSPPPIETSDDITRR